MVGDGISDTPKRLALGDGEVFADGNNERAPENADGAPVGDGVLVSDDSFVPTRVGEGERLADGELLVYVDVDESTDTTTDGVKEPALEGLGDE